jgi:hypothetical protein
MFVGSGLPQVPGGLGDLVGSRRSSAVSRLPHFRRFYHIICILSASKQVLNGKDSGETRHGHCMYPKIGDDHELRGMVRVCVELDFVLSLALIYRDLRPHPLSFRNTNIPPNQNKHPSPVQIVTSSANNLDAHTNSNAPLRSWSTLNTHHSRPSLPQHRVCGRLSNQR